MKPIIYITIYNEKNYAGLTGSTHLAVTSSYPLIYKIEIPKSTKLLDIRTSAGSFPLL